MREADKRVFDALKEYIEKNGYAPTIRELCEITDRHSTSTIQARLFSLERKGFITVSRDDKGKMMCRTIKLINI